MSEVKTFDDKFLELLAELNQVVANVGEKVEGNVFYGHEDQAFPNSDLAYWFANKRANLMTATVGRGRVLEIGTNAGHAALLMLYHNPKLHYTGVDICMHRYTEKAVAFLKNKFPDRVDFYAGDSAHVLPDIFVKKFPAAFDIVHIDGLHTTEQTAQDFENARKLCIRYAWMVIDDTDLPNIAELYDRLVQEEKLLAKKPEDWIDDPYHRIGMLPT